MDITKLKSTGQLIVVTFFIIITLIGGVMASLSLLKEEAVNSNIRLISLQADTFSENLSQSLSALDLLFDSIASFMAVTSEDESLQEQFLAVLKNHPHLRSLNLVEEGKIVLSTNPKNMGLSFDDSDFYPKPFFNQPLLRVGNVIFGRDFHEIYASEKESNLVHIHTSTFIPITKKMVINNKEYCFLLTLNPDYFISAFSSKLQNNAYVDILRADDTLLASSQKSLPLCHICAPNEILEKSKVHNSASGVAIFYNEPYLIASSLTPNYPFTISVRSSYDKSFEDWDNKRYDFFFY